MQLDASVLNVEAVAAVDCSGTLFLTSKCRLKPGHLDQDFRLGLTLLYYGKIEHIRAVSRSKHFA